MPDLVGDLPAGGFAYSPFLSLLRFGASWTGRLRLKAHHKRWYIPKLDNFERRDVPEGAEVALKPLDDSTDSPMCTEICRDWRSLGAPPHPGQRGDQGRP